MTTFGLADIRGALGFGFDEASWILPHARLRFVDAEGDGFAAHGAEMLRRQALFVEAVTGLVEHAEESVAEVFLIVAQVVMRGVAWADAGAEGVDGDIEAACGKIKADGRRAGAGELGLGQSAG